MVSHDHGIHGLRNFRADVLQYEGAGTGQAGMTTEEREGYLLGKKRIVSLVDRNDDENRPEGHPYQTGGIAPGVVDSARDAAL